MGPNEDVTGEPGTFQNRRNRVVYTLTFGQRTGKRETTRRTPDEPGWREETLSRGLRTPVRFLAEWYKMGSLTPLTGFSKTSRPSGVSPSLWSVRRLVSVGSRKFLLRVNRTECIVPTQPTSTVVKKKNCRKSFGLVKFYNLRKL